MSAALIVPAIVAMFIALLTASLLVPGAKADAAGKAIACYMFKAVGVILLAMAGMQLLFSAFIMSLPETMTLLALILFSVVGIGLLVQGSRIVHRIDDASVVVARTVFAYSCTIVGILSAASALLSFVVNFFLTQNAQEWQSPATIMVTGAVLALFSSIYASGKNGKSASRKKK